MPGAPTSEMADELRNNAQEHPTFLTLQDQLTQTDGAPRGTENEGLYVDTEPAPGIVVNGELRVSVARVHSVTSEGQRLVGQIQAVLVVDHPLESWDLRFYVHDPENFHTNDFDDTHAWFVRILDLHYDQATEQVEMAPQIEA